MNIMDTPGNDILNHINDFELYDFTSESNFDHFIDLIRGENEDPVANFDSNLITNLFDQNQFVSNLEVFDGFDDTTTMVAEDPNSNLVVTMPNFDDAEMVVGGFEDNDDGEDSSGTTTTITTTQSKRPKVDRARTLISERKRRDRMKDKLYTLRSLVPNITKMDKASIVGDAILYVQNLQMQAKKLKAEIANLEASLDKKGDRKQEPTRNPKKNKAANKTNHLVSKIITQMDMFQVEERGFYGKVVCNKAERAAISLYKALESLTNFHVKTSNLQTVSDTYTLSFTLHVKESEPDLINLPNLKLWVTGAFANQGFEIKTTFSA